MGETQGEGRFSTNLWDELSANSVISNLRNLRGAKVWGHGFKVVFFFFFGGGEPAQEDIYLLAKQFFLIASGGVF